MRARRCVRVHATDRRRRRRGRATSDERWDATRRDRGRTHARAGSVPGAKERGQRSQGVGGGADSKDGSTHQHRETARRTVGVDEESEPKRPSRGRRARRRRVVLPRRGPTQGETRLRGSKEATRVESVAEQFLPGAEAEKSSLRRHEPARSDSRAAWGRRSLQSSRFALQSSAGTRCPTQSGVALSGGSRQSQSPDVAGDRVPRARFRPS